LQEVDRFFSGPAFVAGVGVSMLEERHEPGIGAQASRLE
jgi:hypothetical protein